MGDFIATLSPSQKAAFIRLVDERKVTIGDGQPVRTAAQVVAYAAACLDYELAVR